MQSRQCFAILCRQHASIQAISLPVSLYLPAAVAMSLGYPLTRQTTV